MKNFLFFLLLFVSASIVAQGKFITKKGTINFEASVPAFEEVKAKNTTVTAILNTDNGEFAALALMKGFRFKNALMEEHFNENYIESDDYPKATFKGNLLDFDNTNIQNEYTIKGTLSLHGKSKEIETKAVLNKDDDDTISITSSFITKAEEFDIKIPGIVSKKIADDVSVSFNFVLKKK
ncbi:YceI family protein [Aquimarina sp. BL5]|uniref:YceI family protein n=1 Tax=Aquimarina sp. BL5 TaxID=1714860 RepID=UPI000E4FFEBA|nr:YceI family protein [Aquimarina sp. BL5]AXT50478.1 YceI family protein [Aquimarina sp. BL5]RKN03056.1 YceI family protein [Aquimarina sp. BL5]